MNNYYYLISSLPTLVYNPSIQLPDCREMLDFIHDNLNEKDISLFQYLLYPSDIKHISNYLSEKAGFNKPYPYLPNDYSFFPLGVEEVKQGISQVDYPFNAFLEERNEEKNETTPIENEKKLWGIFYSSVEATGDAFLIDWFQFDRQLRNTILNSNRRKFDLPETNGKEDFPEIDEANINFPNEKELLHKGNSPVELEMILDKIRWKYLSQLSSLSFFTIHTLFAWYIQYQLLVRWSSTISKEATQSVLKTLIETSMKDAQYALGENKNNEKMN